MILRNKPPILIEHSEAFRRQDNFHGFHAARSSECLVLTSSVPYTSPTSATINPCSTVSTNFLRTSGYHTPRMTSGRAGPAILGMCQLSQDCIKSGLFFPQMHMAWNTTAQQFLWNPAVIELCISGDRRFRFFGISKSGLVQRLFDTAIDSLDHAIGLRMARLDVVLIADNIKQMVPYRHAFTPFASNRSVNSLPLSVSNLLMIKDATLCSLFRNLAELLSGMISRCAHQLARSTATNR
jgi:hypothetical protein